NSTASIRSSYQCNIWSRHCWITSRQCDCSRTSNGWRSNINSSGDELCTCCRITASIRSTISSCSGLGTVHRADNITYKSYSNSTASIRSSYQCNIWSRHCWITSRQCDCSRTSNGWRSNINSSGDELCTCCRITASIRSTISSCSGLGTVHRADNITYKSYSNSTASIRSSYQCNIWSRHCWITSRQCDCSRTSNGLRSNSNSSGDE